MNNYKQTLLEDYDFEVYLYEDYLKEVGVYYGPKKSCKKIVLPDIVNNKPVGAIVCAFDEDDERSNDIEEIEFLSDEVDIISAFVGCDKLRKITIKGSLRHTSYSFYRCDLIYHKEDQIGYININNNKYYLASEALGDKKIIKLNPNTVTVAQEFITYSQLEELDLASVEYISNFAFEGNDLLKKIHFSKKLKHIGKNAFCYCDGLIELTFPQSIEYIGPGAFEFCNNLKKVTLPKKCKIYPDTFPEECTIIFY